MRLNNVIEKEIKSKVREALKSEIKGLKNGEICTINNRNLTKLEMNYSKLSSSVLNVINKNTAELVKDYIKELGLNESMIERAIGFVDIKRIYNREKDLGKVLIDKRVITIDNLGDLEPSYEFISNRSIEKAEIVDMLMRINNLLVVVVEISILVSIKGETEERYIKDIPSLLISNYCRV